MNGLAGPRDIKVQCTCFAISLRQFTPFSKLGNTIEPYFLQSGSGRIFIVTSVTTPSVPVDKMIKESMKILLVLYRLLGLNRSYDLSILHCDKRMIYHIFYTHYGNIFHSSLSLCSLHP